MIALNGAPMKSLLPGHTCQTFIQLVQGTEQALPLYDPVHGIGPGEIVFRHMIVVQRGVLSRELPPPQLESCPILDGLQ